ncbi:AAA-ATPase protein [Vigna angularis]|uniref:AAA-ATPase protein n=1 Tax=Phaseolus angularis TaxID=3914 RepID=A0A8T0JL38_PHAAN|nr:AAA-ATPase protein [Vigna angularis]
MKWGRFNQNAEKYRRHVARSGSIETSYAYMPFGCWCRPFFRKLPRCPWENYVGCSNGILIAEAEPLYMYNLWNPTHRETFRLSLWERFWKWRRRASSWFEIYAAFSTLTILLRTAINDLIPHQFRSYIILKLEGFFCKYRSNNKVSIKINQFWDEMCGERNELFEAALTYLPTKITHTYKSLKVGRRQNHKHLEFAVDGGDDVVDKFEGMTLTWKLNEGSKEDPRNMKNNFVLTFNEKQRQMVLDRYIPHMVKTYEAMKNERRILKLYSWLNDFWNESDLSHPATFDSLALSPELKKDIIDDLDRFLRRKDLYKKVGKAWKRGYLLHGPPGTGKSSLIAAMANYLKFDVFDLELSSIFSNSDLMRCLKEASNRCIIVIEDIDCNKEVHARSNPNGTSEDQDSESDSEGAKKIDPALLRPGRMDMHIHMSFLKGKAFRMLASNYLGIQGHHPLFQQIDDLLEKVEITPAVVGEQLLRYEDPHLCLEELVQFLTLKVNDSNCDSVERVVFSRSIDTNTPN